MSQPRSNTEAARFLVDQASLPEAQIDAMSEPEMAAYLSERGIDVPSLKADIRAMKTRLSGQAALAEARRKRLAQAAQDPTDLSSVSQDEIIASLVKKFGRIEDIPLAARNFQQMQRTDWESLYIDYILRR
jgi:hypothetical protein